MEKDTVNAISVLGLAHIGDAVYETCVRTYLCIHGHKAVSDLHASTVKLVNANAQAAASEIIVPLLSEEELAVYKRGRNAKVNSVPQHSSIAQYHAATGVETLFGWLYLRGESTRINELFNAIMGE